MLLLVLCLKVTELPLLFAEAIRIAFVAQAAAMGSSILGNHIGFALTAPKLASNQPFGTVQSSVIVERLNGHFGTAPQWAKHRA